MDARKKVDAEHQPSLEDTRISVVVTAASTKTHTITLGQALSIIRTGRYCDHVPELRAALARGDEETACRLKKKSLGFLFSGIFSSRRNTGLLEHSGLIPADLDHLDGKLASIIATARKDPCTAMAYVTSSGCGLRLVYRCDPTRPHEEAFGAMERHVLAVHGVHVDPQCRDVARMSFAAPDPDCYFNPAAQPLDQTPPAEPACNSPSEAATQPSNEESRRSSPKAGRPVAVEQVRQLLSFIPPRPPYDGWLRISSAVWSVLPMDAGCEVLKEWSPEEEQGEYRRKWAHRLERITIGTLFYLAKQNGWHPAAGRGSEGDAQAEFDDEDFIASCARDDQRGAARFFAEVARGSFLFDHTARRWRVYRSGAWRADEVRAARLRAKGMISRPYLSLATRLRRRVDADIEAGRITSGKEADNDPRSRLADLLRAEAAKLNKRRQLDDVLNLAGDFLPAVATDFDAKGELLNLRNGTLELVSLTFREHRSEDLLSVQAPVDYSPNAICPKWDAFINTIFGGDRELIGFVQRALGYCLTTDVSQDAIFFGYGIGSNGKTTLFETLRRILGAYLVTLNVETLLTQPRGGRDSIGAAELVKLRGARLALSSEIPDGRRLNEALVKHLTGGDVIKARALYENPFDFPPTHKLWLAGNYKPEIRGIDEAIWRRVYLIPFKHQFPKPGQPDYRDRSVVMVELLGEASGILNWLVAGLRGLREHGMDPPETVRAATEEYRTESDLLGDFLAERCIVEPGRVVASSRLWAAYADFCDTEHSAYPTQRAFTSALQRRGHELCRTSRARMIKGLALRGGDAVDDASDA